MPRTARVAPGGMVFHVLNRGVGRMKLRARFRRERNADFQDFLLLANNFGASNAKGGGVAVVPEPSGTRKGDRNTERGHSTFPLQLFALKTRPRAWQGRVNAALFDHDPSYRREVRQAVRRSSLRSPPLRRCPTCLLYTSPSPRDLSTSRMPSSA